MRISMTNYLGLSTLAILGFGVVIKLLFYCSFGYKQTGNGTSLAAASQSSLNLIKTVQAAAAHETITVHGIKPESSEN